MSRRRPLLLLSALTASEVIRLRLAGPRIWQPENPGGPFLTSVLRLPQPVADRVHRELEPVRRAAPRHYHYPATSLHVTLLNLDWVRAPDEPLEHLARRLVPVVTSVASGAPGMLFRIRGLRLTQHGVFARAAESHAPGTLAGLRHRLADAMSPVASRSGTRARLGEDLAVINVVRYGVRELRPLQEAASYMRRHDFGSFRPETVELVLTDKVLSPSGTRVFADLPLGPTAH